MATEIVHWCDVHLTSADERVPAEVQRRVVIDGDEYAVEVCSSCETTHVQPLIAFVVEYGVREKPTKTKAPKSSTPSTPVVAAHDEVAEARRQRKRDADRERRTGGPIPGNGSRVCPRCGAEAANRTGLGAHAFHAHGVRGLARLWDKSVVDGTDVASSFSGAAVDA